MAARLVVEIRAGAEAARTDRRIGDIDELLWHDAEATASDGRQHRGFSFMNPVIRFQEYAEGD
ncbi:MAG: hypothetical protein AB7G13_13345 [Lautropia sp.]